MALCDFGKNTYQATRYVEHEVPGALERVPTKPRGLTVVCLHTQRSATFIRCSFGAVVAVWQAAGTAADGKMLNTAVLLAPDHGARNETTTDSGVNSCLPHQKQWCML
jgi:hypothetical protein